MNELGALACETVEKICADLCDADFYQRQESGGWPGKLWTSLEEAGVLQATFPESAGGSALDPGSALPVLIALGRRGVSAPCAETLLVGDLLGEQAASLEGPVGIVCAQGAKLTEESEGCQFSTVLHGRSLRFLVVSDTETDSHHLLDCKDAEVEEGYNLAGDPVDCLRFRKPQVTSLPGSRPAMHSFALLALSRSLLMAGAMEVILEMSVEYALQRVQFGRPIASFQAIQHQLAVAAGEVAAARRAAESALGALSSPGASFAIAVSKIRAGEAAGEVARIAHQTHGAMGYTHEYPLHGFTRRLWSWRDDHGSEAYWQRLLGRGICRLGADQLWSQITAPGPLLWDHGAPPGLSVCR